MTLADKVTLARLMLMPLIVAGYLLLPMERHLVFWVCGWLCALAEYTDLMDGRIARRRGEVSDFGKLADPFCDVVYRLGVFLILLLPVAGVGYAVTAGGPAGITLGEATARFDVIPLDHLWPGQLVYVTGTINGQPQLATSPVPWLPVFLMVMREIIAGALRAMTATKGLVLAARTSGKVKAWIQGITIITLFAYPACFWYRAEWHLAWGFWMTWLCALVSVASILEYIWVNRGVLGQMLSRR
jgi:phosphatidylglycerophosphate synthase